MKTLLEDIRGALRSECCTGIHPQTVARLLTRVEHAMTETRMLRALMDNEDPRLPKWEERTQENRSAILANDFQTINKAWEEIGGP